VKNDQRELAFVELCVGGEGCHGSCVGEVDYKVYRKYIYCYPAALEPLLIWIRSGYLEPDPGGEPLRFS